MASNIGAAARSSHPEAGLHTTLTRMVVQASIPRHPMGFLLPLH
jgi:hypothetical protein